MSVGTPTDEGIPTTRVDPRPTLDPEPLTARTRDRRSAPGARPGLSGLGSKPALDRLARAVADPGRKALVIEADNRASGWRSLSEAQRAGLTAAVSARAEMISADADSPAAADACRVWAREAERLGERPVILPSGGGPGRFHLWCRVLQPSRRRRLWLRARELGVPLRGRVHHERDKGARDQFTDGPLRPPLSRHRSGAWPPIPRGLTVASIQDALAGLSGRTLSDLSPTGLALLRQGDVAGRYDSRSRVVAAMCLHFARAGFAFEDAVELLADPKHAAGERYREEFERNGPDRALAWLSFAWRWAQLLAERTAPIASRRDVQDAIARIRAEAGDPRWWRGKAGASARALLRVILDTAERHGTLSLPVPVRSGTEAGLGRSTVSRALRYLEGLSSTGKRQRDRDRRTWLRRSRTTQGADAAEFDLVVPQRAPAACGGTGTLPDTPRLDSVPLGPHAERADAFRWRALGKNAPLVLGALTDEWAGTRVLSDRAGLPIRTAGRLLSALHVAALVSRRVVTVGRRSSFQWQRVAVSDEVLVERLDLVAANRGTLGVGERQVKQVAREREAFRDMLAELMPRVVAALDAVVDGASVRELVDTLMVPKAIVRAALAELRRQERAVARRCSDGWNWFARSRVGETLPRNEQEGARPEREGVRERTAMAVPQQPSRMPLDPDLEHRLWLERARGVAVTLAEKIELRRDIRLRAEARDVGGGRPAGEHGPPAGGGGRRDEDRGD